MRKVNLYNIAMLAALLAVSCAKTDSDNIKTSGFYASYSVIVSDTNPTVAQCSASFTVEQGGTWIELGSSDSVTCNGQSMTKTVIGAIVNYNANLTATVGGTYTLVLTRQGENPYSAAVVLPAAIVTSAPPANFSQGKGNSLSLAWTSSASASDTMVVTTNRVTSSDTTCPLTARFEDSAPENGVGSFSSADMSLPSSGTAGTCLMKVVFERIQTGTMPAGLNGSIQAVQQASISGSLL